MKPPLFRQQVVEKRRQRLYGDVVISDTRISSIFVVAIGIFSLCLIFWAITASYPRTTQVTGIITTSRPSARIFGVRSGVLERLFVRDGQHVLRGQAIAFVGVDVQDGARHSAASDSLVALQHQGEAVDVQLRAQDQTRKEEKVRLIHAMRSNDGEQQSIRRQIAIQAAIVQTSSGNLARIMPVVDKGFISQFEVDRRRQLLLTQQQQREQLHQQLVQLVAKKSELQAQLQLLPIESEKRTAELRGQHQVISQQISHARVEVGYTIIAPIGGRVTALQTNVGKPVDPRIPVMALVPEKAEFQAELFAPSQAAGFIRAGQHVRIMYDAFPYKQFGSFDGQVIGMSRTAFAPGELEVPLKLDEAVYRVRADLKQQKMSSTERSLPLQLGMTLSATIILERRSFVDWLLQPLNAVRRRA